jgi:diaminopimelate decarboxylase
MIELIGVLRADGHTIDHFDIGGGLGVPYRDDNAPPPDPDAYGKMVKARLGDLGCQVILEPGRLIVANAGVLVTEVIYVKDGGDKTFVIVDAAMNDLIRPTLYEAWHEIRPVKLSAASAPRIRADIVGPVCESGDYLAKDREMTCSQGRRTARGWLCRRLWRGSGRHLQHPPAGARSAGQWRCSSMWFARDPAMTT